jgi:hypothetical protein
VSRVLTRAATATTGAVLTVLVTAAPALAGNPLGPSEGADPGRAIGLVRVIALYVGTPVLACLLIAAIVLVPGAVRSHRYRPAEGWTADPVWFAGPVDVDAVVAAADRGEVARGGASGSW